MKYFSCESGNYLNMRGSRIDLLEKSDNGSVTSSLLNMMTELNKYLLNCVECEEMSLKYLILQYKAGSSKKSRKSLLSYLTISPSFNLISLSPKHFFFLF